MSNRLIPKEDFATLILDERFSFDERKLLVTDEMRIELPQDIQDGQPFLDYVYNYYLKAFEYHELALKRTYHKEEENTPREGSIKEWIVNYIFDKKNLKISELRDTVDEAFGYKAKGKSSRTRVRKVVQQLLADKKIIQIDSDTIQWK